MTLIEHKKARLNYELLEEFEAGIVLEGFEVKALRQKMGKLEGTHVIIRGGEAYVVGMHIPPYQPSNTPETYEPERTRKLLFNKKELVKLAAAESQKGLTIVPISIYTKNRKLKVRVAIVRGRKKYDKREVLKARDAKRDIDRSLKNQ